MKSGDRVREIRGWTSGRARRREAVEAAGVEVGHVHVQGLRLRYAQSKGTGEPLLFCNGIGANFELLLPFVRAMNGRRVILFDVPGTGGSQASWFWPSFPTYARFAVGILDHLGHSGSFAVAGVSWGGGLAQQIAHDYQTRVSRLILMATCAGFLMFPGRPSALVRMLTPQRYLSRTFMARNAATIYGGEMRGRPDLATDLANLTRAPSTLTYLQQLTALTQLTSPWWLHRIRCPTLVMNGDDDPLMRTVNARILAALLGNARLHVVRGGGHLFLALQAEETARVVAGFLDETADRLAMATAVPAES